MRDILAERLLGQVMNWEPKDVAYERPILQALAALKYDEYQQFSPGMGFVESLAIWLNQFTLEERKVMYKFFKEKLIFFSNVEMNHLVSICFPDFIRPILVELAAKRLGISKMFPRKIINSDEYQELLQKSLFLGLSDGAHIDVFRRSNPELSHEQILPLYDISNEKAKDLMDELKKRLENIHSFDELNPDKVKFRTIFLLDDFSASGISYLREEKKDSELIWNGKIKKVLDRIEVLSSGEYELFDLKEITICVVLYIATQKALNTLEKKVKYWVKEHKSKIKFQVLAIQIIQDEISLNIESEKDVAEIIKKYHNPSIETASFKKGNLDKPYLGFHGCALPIILSHNTPNNSLPILWHSDDKQSVGLFPRVSRHT